MVPVPLPALNTILEGEISMMRYTFSGTSVTPIKVAGGAPAPGKRMVPNPATPPVVAPKVNARV